MNKTQYTFIPSSQSPIPSPLPLRVIHKSKMLDSAALATQERLTRYRFSQGETLRERYRIAIHLKCN
ncbi:MAG TPA: hypothetical protein VE956_02330 [Nodularia sp. (in: cyanobacteria)]|nr:hypothetical protein [Nodularia sp. (in: cyanobacteria)]